MQGKTYEDIRLEAVKNGFILRYRECYKEEHKSSIEPMSYNYVEEVYKDDEMADAVAKMKVLRDNMK